MRIRVLLDLLIHKEGPSSPRTIKDAGVIYVSKPHISNRLSTLADHGLLLRLPNGVYAMTDEGEAYLNGEYDAEDEEFIQNPDEYGIGSTEPGENGA